MEPLFVSTPSLLHAITAKRQRHSPLSPLRPRSCATNKANATNESSTQSPLSPPVRAGRVSHALVLEQAATAISQHSNRLLTVDFPPERTETRSGTLVARFENNLNFAERLARKLAGVAPTSVGGAVSIRDNVNPQGGGEYLDDDETLTGARAGKFTIALNAGVDASTLKQAPDLDNGGTLVLLNCGLDRLSWFDRRALRGALDGFDTAYYLKVVAGVGLLLKATPHPWRAYVVRSDGFDIVMEWSERPKMSEVEAVLRTEVAKLRAGK